MSCGIAKHFLCYPANENTKHLWNLTVHRAQVKDKGCTVKSV